MDSRDKDFTSVRVVDSEDFNNCRIGWSFFSVICCGQCLICALAGFLASILEYTDFKAGDIYKSRDRRRWAVGCTATAIILGVLLLAAWVVAWVLFGDTFIETFREYADQLAQQE